MQTFSQIVRTQGEYHNIHLPEWAVGKDVVVIVLPLADADQRVEVTLPEHKTKGGPLSVLGYAKTFRPTRSTDEWMQDLREGEDN